MYDRASRILTRPADGTLPQVGPGTYYRPCNTPTEGYAPFLSMSVRESFLTSNKAPGPGYYSPSIGYNCAAKGGSSLNNKSGRFESFLSSTPGPGSYSISSDWPKFHSHKIKPSHIKFNRPSNAPSIPSVGFNNGYEEDNGVLKPQMAPVSDTSIGPAFYTPLMTEVTSLQNYKGVHFGALRSKRAVFKGQGGPGPCDYSPEVMDSGKSTRFIPTNIPRYHELITKEECLKGIPGPGEYELKSQFEARAESADHQKAAFGSLIQRFQNEKEMSPACTAYHDPRTALSSIQRLQGMKKTPFGQSSSRFKVNKDDIILPGPGTYNDNYVTGMSSRLIRRTMLTGFNQCPFGTSSSRTVPLTKKDEALMPGPAHYQDSKAKVANNPSQVFASRTNRLSTPPKDNPSPGSYEVYRSFMNTQGKLDSSALKTGFLSTLERFAPPRDIALEEPDILNPGPGEYDEDKKHHHVGGVMLSEKPRFQVLKSRAPGPGAYNLSKIQKDTLLRGTFNVTLYNKKKSSTLCRGIHVAS